MTHFQRGIMFCGVAIAALCAASPAMAQEKKKSDDDSRFGGEIIVTATKRAENVQ